MNSPSNTDRVTSNTRDSATSPIVIHHVQQNARTHPPELGRAQQQPATQARAGGALQMPSHTTQPTNIDNNVSQNYGGYASAQRPATQGPAGQTSNRATATQAPSDPTQAPSADEQRSSTPREDVENQWQEARNGRRNRRGNNTTRSNTVNNRVQNNSLRGIRPEQSVELYVQNIARGDDESDKSIADKVRKYCKDKGVRVMAARVISNRFCDDMVGCRITVPARQVDDALGSRMWPEDVVCRRWRKARPAEGTVGGEGNERANDGERRGTSGGLRAGRPQRQQRRGPTRQDLRDQGQREQQDWYDDDREHHDPAEYVRGPQRQGEQYWWERDDDDGHWDTEPQYTEDRYNGYREQERARRYG